MSERAIGDYALLSDCNSAALVSNDGSVDWLCLPRFDSSSVFARLLDDDAGHWSLRPADAADSERRYLADSMVLETRYTTPEGVAVVSEAMVFDGDSRGHEIGLDVPHTLVRVVEIVEGDVAIESELAPRSEFGVVTPRIEVLDRGLVVVGGATRLMLSAPNPRTVEDGTVRWRFRLGAGQSAGFALQHVPVGQPLPRSWTGDEITQRLHDTTEAWRSWSGLHQRYEGPWRDEVHHSGRVLQALTYRPSGAIVAAPTTSLPEQIGGGRNWDYRYTWVRDASLAMQALWTAACPDEAGQFLSFLIDASGAGSDGQRNVHIMYGIGGEHDLSERELPHLRGWRSSRPVRVGNAAWSQTQHDTYGALLDAAYCYRAQLDDLDAGSAAFLIAMADTAAEVWTQPDQGLWELRGAPRRHVHSMLMCWVALDRAVQLADLLKADVHVARWKVTAELIRAEIIERGWNERVGAYTQTLDGDELDASVLLMAITGFLPATDAKMRATIEAIADGLSSPDGLLYRYRGDDHLDGGESPFLICSFWLAECWALAGDLTRARATFTRAAACANDVGLLSEEADVATGELLGNYPQAFSHIGLINAAATIAAAEAGISDAR